MEGVKLPPLANVLRLFSGHASVDYKENVDDLKVRLLQDKLPVAFLICRGGDLDHEAAKLKLLSQVCRDLSGLDDATKKLQVVLLVSNDATEEMLRAALQKLPAAFGGSMTPSDSSSKGTGTAALPPNPQPPWIAVACVPSEADVFGSMIQQKTEMLVLLLDILGSATGRLALFGPDGVGLAREGQVVLEQYGADAAWPYTEARVRELELSSGKQEAGPGSMHPLPELFVFPAGTESGKLVRKAASGSEKLEPVGLDSLESTDIAALYFGASWCDPCVPLTKRLEKVREEVTLKNGPSSFKVVFVTYDESEKDFLEDFKETPVDWLALPFRAASASREKLTEAFGIRGIPCIVLLKGNGTLVSTEGREIITDTGSEGFPFSAADVASAREAQRRHRQKLREEMTLRTALCSPARDYLINGQGEKVPVSTLEDRKSPIGLLFTSRDSYLCTRFAESLLEAYKDLQNAGSPFEVVLVSMDESEEAIEEHMHNAPWLAIPHVPGDEEASRLKDLRSMFDGVKGLPALIVLNGAGQVVTQDGADKIREMGAKAYPFDQ